ncbi:hypothetical protein V8E51_013605 [Hyaloscypha variabilis]
MVEEKPGRSPLNPYRGVHALRNRRSLVASGQTPLGVGPMQIPITSQNSLVWTHNIPPPHNRKWAVACVDPENDSSSFDFFTTSDLSGKRSLPVAAGNRSFLQLRPALASRVEAPVCATRISSQIHNAIRCGQYPFLLPECMHLRAYLATPVHLESALNMSLLCRDAQPSKRSATITPCVPAYLRHWGRYRFETSGAKTMHSSRVHPRIMNS